MASMGQAVLATALCLGGVPPVRIQCQPGAERYERMVRDAWDSSSAKIEARTRLPVPLGISVTLCGGKGQFERIVEGVAPWAGAVALARDNSIVINGAMWQQLSRTAKCTLAHELSHLTLAAAAREQGTVFPRWFDEGLACWASEASHLGDMERFELANAVGQLPSLAALTQAFPDGADDAALAYLTSERFVGYLAARYGDEAIGDLVEEALESRSFGRAFESIFRRSVAAMEAEWRKQLKHETPAVWTLIRNLNIFAIMGLLVVGVFVVTRLRNRRVREAWRQEGLGF